MVDSRFCMCGLSHAINIDKLHQNHYLLITYAYHKSANELRLIIYSTAPRGGNSDKITPSIAATQRRNTWYETV